MLIRSNNLISCESEEKQELATLKKILSDYENKNYHNMYILIMNYLGHTNHYCGHEGLVYRLLDNFTYMLENPKEPKDDSFIRFVKNRIYNVENRIQKRTSEVI